MRGEFQALISGCGVYDLGSRAKISITGGDRVRWLNGMVTNNVRDLKPGHGVYAFLLNPQGHILGDMYAYNRGESLLIDTDGSQVEKILAVFDKYIIMDDVEATNIADKIGAIGIAGPDARECLGNAGITVPALEPLQFVEATWQQTNIVLVRGDNPLVESFELWLAPENTEAASQALVKAGAKSRGIGGDRVVEDRGGRSALRRRYPRTRFAAGDGAGACAELRQRLLCGPGNRGANSFSRTGTAQVYRL